MPTVMVTVNEGAPPQAYEEAKEKFSDGGIIVNEAEYFKRFYVQYKVVPAYVSGNHTHLTVEHDQEVKTQ
ncbi:hypothetical protein BO78DRAFT_416631 [Aspergillus sclerotiicarbonarius CBS 121057]|uniref:Inhibitor I9 domain-containing protein n=1 Tax=Aspergillus sclerotiicarbonarius (strain CBS 121057 / IBT 28362) TaxID=1448318 RepID=A0A319EDX5_ASPSB|nr:hypothetical protein BO78DRAFT_416631 [Aspergillus sclerotiicarbonarius CBS 121057]